jgi:hypothetical protein
MKSRYERRIGSDILRRLEESEGIPRAQGTTEMKEVKNFAITERAFAVMEGTGRQGMRPRTPGGLKDRKGHHSMARLSQPFQPILYMSVPMLFPSTLMMPTMTAPAFITDSPRILAYEQRCSVIYVPGAGRRSYSLA